MRKLTRWLNHPSYQALNGRLEPVRSALTAPDGASLALVFTNTVQFYTQSDATLRGYLSPTSIEAGVVGRAWRGASRLFVVMGLAVAAACRGATDVALDDGGAQLDHPPPVAPPAGPPAAPPPPGSPGALPHATDFLTAGCRTHLYATFDAAERERCRTVLRQRSYTHIYVYAYNEHDYGGPSFDFFADPGRFRQLLAELKSSGLEPVVWLIPDDASSIAGMPAREIQTKLAAFVPAVDDLVSSYVLGLELDEYWLPAKVDSLGSRLSDLTSRPIAVHQLPGKWDYCAFSWCDYLILQYGFDKTPSDIHRMTSEVLAALGKPVVAGEYEVTDESKAIAFGNVGVAAGASGFGNGGTRGSIPSRRVLLEAR